MLEHTLFVLNSLFVARLSSLNLGVKSRLTFSVCVKCVSKSMSAPSPSQYLAIMTCHERKLSSMIKSLRTDMLDSAGRVFESKKIALTQLLGMWGFIEYKYAHRSPMCCNLVSQSVKTCFSCVGGLSSVPTLTHAHQIRAG